MEPLVSVIIPLYNHQNYIVACLQSILNDGYGNKEIIVIDDGSTDESKSVVSTWLKNNNLEEKIRFISRENKGLTKTLNELISIAKGEYIKFIASDDFIVSNGIKKSADYLISHPDCDVVIGDAVTVDDAGAVISNSCLFEYRKRNLKNYLNPHSLRSEIIVRWSLPGPVSFMRRDFLIKIGMFDENLVIEDWDFFLRIIISGKLHFINETVAAYRLHNSNASRVVEVQRRIRNISNMIKTIDKNINSFAGYEKSYLGAMRESYKAKIAYLRQEKIRCAMYLGQYVLKMSMAKVSVIYNNLTNSRGGK